MAATVVLLLLFAALGPGEALEEAERVMREDPDRAVALYLDAAEAYAATGDGAGETLALMGAFRTRTRRLELDEAAALLERLREAAARCPDPALRLDARFRESFYWFHRGEIARAYLIDREVETHPGFSKLAPKRRFDVLNAAHTSAAFLGLTEKAYRYGLRAQALAEEYDMPPKMRASPHSLLAQTSLSLYREGRMSREQALSQALRAVEISREAGSVFMLIPALDVATQLEAPGSGTELLEELYSLGQRYHCAQFSAYARSRQAKRLIEDDTLDVDQAFVLLEEALELAEEQHDILARLQVIQHVGRLRMIAGPRAQAVNDALRALDGMEAYRLLQTPGELRAGWLAQHAFWHWQLIGYLLDVPGGPTRRDIERAFVVAERLRARELLDRLTEAAPEAAREIAEARGKLQAEITGLQIRLARAEDGGERAALLGELERLEVREQVIKADLAAELLPEPEFATPAAVRDALREVEALVTFVVAREENGGSWVVTLTRDGEQVHRLPGRPAIDAAVRFWLGLIRARDPMEPELAARLGEMLLGPVLASLPETVRHLVIVPDGALHHVPFPALRVAPDAPPLAERFTVAHVPSATLWLRLRERDRGAITVRPLVLADPEPWDRAATSESRRLARDAWNVGPLPHAREEGRAVLEAFAGRGMLHEGAEASEARVKAARLGRHGLVHFAAHAVVDDRAPERSAIVLHPGSAEEDGLLQPREIVNLPLQGGIVTLAACRSGSGRVLGGEGPLSLGRSFFEAGARTVLATLWPLRDDDARRFFGAFYRRLASGQRLAGALAATRREMIAEGLPTSAWAGVVVLGDGSLAVRPARRSALPARTVGLLAAAGMAGVLLLTAWRARRRRTGNAGQDSLRDRSTRD